MKRAAQHITDDRITEGHIIDDTQCQETASAECRTQQGEYNGDQEPKRQKMIDTEDDCECLETKPDGCRMEVQDTDRDNQVTVLYSNGHSKGSGDIIESDTLDQEEPEPKNWAWQSIPESVMVRGFQVGNCMCGWIGICCLMHGTRCTEKAMDFEYAKNKFDLTLDETWKTFSEYPTCEDCAENCF